MSKERVTVTLDKGLVAAARTAVEAGRSESISAFVNESLVARLERDERLTSLSELIAVYETEHGVITEREMAEQERRDEEAAATFRTRMRQTG